jgi:iron complex outermembrane receptor protein
MTWGSAMASPLAASIGIFAALWTGAAAAQPAGPASEFWDPQVVTPAGQPSRVSESPSTTFVITGDEVRRSGAPSLPELLRRVPGVDVRTITAVDGQLGLRGFAYEVSDRILVLIDGRTAYIDFFGGTAWEMLPVSLLDVERIEIVLGPGASVYGNKAMLGTVNIITRSANDYPLLEARVDGGNPEDGRVAARVAAIRGPWQVRATALARRLTLFDPAGRPATAAGGGTLTASWNPSAGTEAAVELGAVGGNVFMIPVGTSVQEFDATLAYVRARGRHGLGGPGAPYGDVNVDLVMNAGRIRSPTFPSGAGDFRADYLTPYAQASHLFRTHLFGVPMHARWGGEVRLNTLDSTITSSRRPLWNVAGFASNEALLGRWRVTTGLRVDRATLSSVTVSPRVSVVWSPAEGHQLRAAFNTGYNNPHHVHYFADFDVTPTIHVTGSRHLSAERVLYGELGWTGALTGWLRGFATGFLYRFTDWMSLDPLSASAAGVPWGNNRPFDAGGFEAGLEIPLRGGFSAHANYALVETLGAGVYPYRVDPLGSPRHKVGAGFRLGFEEGAYLDVAGQWVGPSVIARVTEDPLAAEVFEEFPLDGYVMAHARGGYAFRNGLDLSLAASNVLDASVVQFPGAEHPERRFTATLAWTH